jgi:transposase-like protein
MLCRYRHNVHLIRNTFRYASRADCDALARDLRPVYTAVNAEMAAVRFEDFADKWGTRYPAIIKLSSLRPSARTPIMTSRHSLCSSKRMLTWMPSTHR